MPAEQAPHPWPLAELRRVLDETGADLSPEEWSARSGWPAEAVSALLRPEEVAFLRSLPSPIRAKTLRSLREGAGYSLAEAAKRSGVAATTLENWERGPSLPSEALLGFLLTAYGR